jgi:ornithine cyclodeaminase
LREAGDILQAIAAGVLGADDLIDLADLLALSPEPGISVFKSVGMGWQDLAVAESARAAWSESQAATPLSQPARRPAR